jgi:hypothetical protein
MNLKVNMETKELLTLFEDTCIRKEWGEDSYIRIYNDGSGTVYSSDNDELFSFVDIEELIGKLKD